MARGIEVDWVVIRVNTVRRLIAVAGIAVAAAAVLVFAYTRINLPPDARAQRAIERAQAAEARVAKNPLPERWEREIAQATSQLDSAREAFANEKWDEAMQLAEAARTRFENVLGAGMHKLAGDGQIFSLEGRVQVQRAGKATWNDAHQGMPVFNGDFVKSGRDGSAEILMADGSLYRISPNSLIEIYQHASANAPANGGTVKMVVGRLNVYTSGSSSTVTTESAQTRVDRDSRVAVDVAEESRSTTVAAYSGRATVRNQKGEELVVTDREQVAASKEGVFSEKRKIPNPPLPLAPANNTAFDLADQPEIELKWRAPDGVEAVFLQVSRSKRFAVDQLDVNGPVPRLDGARLKAVAPGTYYWRVASGTQQGAESEWSSVGRFQILAPGRRVFSEDRVPPQLKVQEPQLLGNYVIIEGDTEVGATVTINGEPVELEGSGHFRKAVEFKKEGWNELVIVAVDPSGNRQEETKRVFVEF